ncbi:DNA-binding protein [Alphaproteobacteria bacterium]|nr:DNA-binding protein [Alphaproteobacteria bacterium]
MKITADTNVLLRAFTNDDAVQSLAAVEMLEAASLVAVSQQVLCEFVWVLNRQYDVSRADIAAAIRQLLDTKKIVMNRLAVEAGLSVLEAGGDFADGVISWDGDWLGGETFVSFDKKAVRILEKQGRTVRLIS